MPVAEPERLKGLLLDNGAAKTHEWLAAGKGKPRKEWFTETLRVYEPKGSSNASILTHTSYQEKGSFSGAFFAGQ
jgi:hypothetical protein